MKFIKNRFMKITALVISISACVFILKTMTDLEPLPSKLIPDASDISRMSVLDRNNVPLNITYQNRWNTHDYIPLYEIPEFLQQAFVVSEDKRFYSHSGIDWLARFNALRQNIMSMGGVRGASTISEQVVKMLHPRKRTVWARWLEGFEAQMLEKRFAKTEILEFYLNEVPYASNRRGVVQAARFFFDRDLDTLSRKEILSLAVMVRAPSRYNLKKNKNIINRPIARLTELLNRQGLIDEKSSKNILNEKIILKDTGLTVDAGHFVDHIFGKYSKKINPSDGRIVTTLDSFVQSMSKTILDNQLKGLARKNVKNGAALVVDNKTGEVLAWAVNGTRSDEIQGSWIDSVTTPRQPGSTLKPFVYALALEKGWTAATVIDDSPLTEAVGTGLHSYNNYSRVYYGKLPLRQCLGNSLNIPAVKTLQYVGVDSFLTCLHDLGMQSLVNVPDFYGDGLVLGNGEITLFELVQAYTVFANRGVYKPLKVIQDDFAGSVRNSSEIFSQETASLIGNILSDSRARRLEFGSGGVLNFPVQTAVKTGTSNDYRDAWSVGYNNDYTVGVWMGNLDRTAMDRITGAKGPAIVLRSIFAELNRNHDTKPLYLSPQLVQKEVCTGGDNSDKDNCKKYSEWFIPGTGLENIADIAVPGEQKIDMLQPSPGLRMAMDPRIPDAFELFVFRLSGVPGNSRVEWYVDNKLEAVTASGDYSWHMKKGKHTVYAKVHRKDKKQKHETDGVEFYVK